MSPYIPILGIMALAAAFLVVSVVASLLVGPRRYNRAKYDTYECGIDATPAAVGGGRFPVKYYITAMMFIVFDIEVVFLLPWAVAYNQLSTFAVVAMIRSRVDPSLWLAVSRKNNPNDWGLPGGKVDPDETSQQAIRREVMEETGITDLDFRWGFDYRDTPPYGRGKVARYYVAETAEHHVTLPVNPALGRAEHEEFRWVTRAAARDLVVPRVAAILDWAVSVAGC